MQECGARVVRISEEIMSSGVDLADLEQQLKSWTIAKRKIGSFSAASNVTGIMTQVQQLTDLMHKYGGIAVFDYASGTEDVNAILELTSQADGYIRRRLLLYVEQNLDP